MVAARYERLDDTLEPRHKPSPSIAGGRARGLVVSISILVAVVACGVSFALGENPLVCRGWLGAHGAASWLLSLGLGLLVGTLTVAATPVVVRRWRWARALHAALRPTADGAGDGALFAVAIATATGEELLFRGLLVPLAGVVASSILFATMHQIRGNARWAWMVWAGIMGLLFGTIFAATGSLAGSLLAHAAINHHNLRFLRDHNPSAPVRSLGGLLRR
jgi:CAAX protease family protein